MNTFFKISLAALLVTIALVSACTQELPKEQKCLDKQENPLTLVLSLDDIHKVPGLLGGKEPA